MKQTHRLVVIILFLFALVPVPALAAERINVSLTPDRHELTVGDPVRLTLEVRHPADTQVILPELEKTWGDVEVRSQSGAETINNDDGTNTTRQTIEVTLFTPGEFQTPPLPITISDSAGQVVEELAPPVALTVDSVLPEGDTTLEDIRPQLSLMPPSVWPMVIIGLTLATVTAGGGWWLYRRWRNGSGLVDNRLPYEVALDELARIEGLHLAEQGEFKAHYTLVSDCLREYLERQFKLHAFDRTTAELNRDLRRVFKADQAHRFTNLFAESDLVKFAKLTPDVEIAQQFPEQARTLVVMTRPQPETAKSATPPKGGGVTPKPAEVQP